MGKFQFSYRLLLTLWLNCYVQINKILVELFDIFCRFIFPVLQSIAPLCILMLNTLVKAWLALWGHYLRFVCVEAGLRWHPYYWNTARLWITKYGLISIHLGSLIRIFLLRFAISCHYFSCLHYFSNVILSLWIRYCGNSRKEMLIWIVFMRWRKMKLELLFGFLTRERYALVSSVLWLLVKFLLTNAIYIPFLKLIKQYVGYFPYVNLSATVSPITRTVLKVRASATSCVLFLLSYDYSYAITYDNVVGWPAYNTWICVERSLPWHVRTMVDYCRGMRVYTYNCYMHLWLHHFRDVVRMQNF
jgi:hypothetical protein